MLKTFNARTHERYFSAAYQYKTEICSFADTTIWIKTIRATSTVFHFI